MNKSTEILEEISKKCLDSITIYKYSKYLKSSQKYRDGRVTASKWVNELVFHFIQKERSFLLEFQDYINKQKQTIGNLKDGDYKQGLMDELNAIQETLNDRINCK